MVTEKEILAILPPDGFIRAMVDHGYANTTGPIGYHLATALAILAVTTPTQYGMRYAGALHANIYSMLVGRSGDDQKSTCIKLAKNILYRAASILIGDQPGSAEGLIEGLRDQPTQLLQYSEFGKFLASSQKGYFEAIKPYLTDIWDCEPQQRRKSNDVIVKVDDPRLSMLVGCSIPYLERHTGPEDWNGGFLGRWFIVYGKRERVDPDPQGDDTLLEYLVQSLSVRAKLAEERNLKMAGNCLGLSPDAKKMWNEWFLSLDKRKFPELIAGAKVRAPTLARKVSLLYGWDIGPATGADDWEMSDEILWYGIAAAEIHLQSVLGLSERLADHGEAQQRRTVIDTIPMGGSLKLSDMLIKTKMKRATLMGILEGLFLEGTFRKHQLHGGNMLIERPVVDAPEEE